MSILYDKENYLFFSLLMTHAPLQTTLQKMNEASLHHDKKKRQEVVQHLRSEEIKNILTADNFDANAKKVLEALLEYFFGRIKTNTQARNKFWDIEIASFFDPLKYEENLRLLEACVVMLPEEIETEEVLLQPLTVDITTIFTSRETIDALLAELKVNLPGSSKKELLRYLLNLLPREHNTALWPQFYNSVEKTEKNAAVYEVYEKLWLVTIKQQIKLDSSPFGNQEKLYDAVLLDPRITVEKNKTHSEVRAIYDAMDDVVLEDEASLLQILERDGEEYVVVAWTNAEFRRKLDDPETIQSKELLQDLFATFVPQSWSYVVNSDSDFLKTRNISIKTLKMLLKALPVWLMTFTSRGNGENIMLQINVDLDRSGDASQEIATLRRKKRIEKYIALYPQKYTEDDLDIRIDCSNKEWIQVLLHDVHEVVPHHSEEKITSVVWFLLVYGWREFNINDIRNYSESRDFKLNLPERVSGTDIKELLPILVALGLYTTGDYSTQWGPDIHYSIRQVNERDMIHAAFSEYVSETISDRIVLPIFGSPALMSGHSRSTFESLKDDEKKNIAGQFVDALIAKQAYCFLEEYCIWLFYGISAKDYSDICLYLRNNNYVTYYGSRKQLQLLRHPQNDAEIEVPDWLVFRALLLDTHDIVSQLLPAPSGSTNDFYHMRTTVSNMLNMLLFDRNKLTRLDLEIDFLDILSRSIQPYACYIDALLAIESLGIARVNIKKPSQGLWVWTIRVNQPLYEKDPSTNKAANNLDTAQGLRARYGRLWWASLKALLKDQIVTIELIPPYSGQSWREMMEKLAADGFAKDVATKLLKQGWSSSPHENNDTPTPVVWLPTPQQYVDDYLSWDGTMFLTADILAQNTQSLILDAMDIVRATDDRDYDFYSVVDENDQRQVVKISHKDMSTFSQKYQTLVFTQLSSRQEVLQFLLTDTENWWKETVDSNLIDTAILQHLTHCVASLTELLAVIVSQNWLEQVHEDLLRKRLLQLMKDWFVRHPQAVPAWRPEKREDLYVLTVSWNIKATKAVTQPAAASEERIASLASAAPVVTDSVIENTVTMPAWLESRTVKDKAYRQSWLNASGIPEKAKQSFVVWLDMLTSTEVLLKQKNEKPKTEYDIFLVFEEGATHAVYHDNSNAVVIIDDTTPLYYTLWLSDTLTATKDAALLTQKRKRLIEEKQQLDTVANTEAVVPSILLLWAAFAQLRRAEKAKKVWFLSRTLAIHLEPKAKSPFYTFLNAVDTDNGFAMKELLLAFLPTGRQLCLEMLKILLQRATKNKIDSLEQSLEPLLKNKEMRTLWQEAKGLAVVAHETNALQEVELSTWTEWTDPEIRWEAVEAVGESFDKLLGMTSEHVKLLHTLWITTYELLWSVDWTVLANHFPNVRAATMRPAQALIVGKEQQLRDLQVFAIREWCKTHIASQEAQKTLAKLQQCCQEQLNTTESVTARQIIVWFIAQELNLRDDDPLLLTVWASLDDDTLRFSKAFMETGKTPRLAMQVNKILLSHIDTLTKGNETNKPILTRKVRPEHKPLDAEYVLWSEDEAEEVVDIQNAPLVIPQISPVVVAPPSAIEELLVTERVDLSQASDQEIINYLGLRIPESSEDPIWVMDLRNEVKGTRLDLQKFMAFIKQLCTISPNAANSNNPFIRLK